MCRTDTALYLQSFILGTSAVESLRSDQKSEMEQHRTTEMKNLLFVTEKNPPHMLHFFLLNVHEKTELLILFSRRFFLSKSDKSSCDELYYTLKS